MIRKTIHGNRAQLLPLSQIATNDANPVLQKGRVEGVMDVAFNGRSIHSNLSCLLQPLLFGIVYNNPVDPFPGLLTQRLDVVLQSRARRALTHSQSGESPEGPRVGQMKSQLLIGQTPVLLQHGAAHDLFSCHPNSAGIRPFGTNQVSFGQVQYRRVVLKYLGDSGQLPANSRVGYNVGKAQLIGSLLPHFGSTKKSVYKLKSIG